LQEDWQTLFLYQTKLEQLQQKWVQLALVLVVAVVVVGLVLVLVLPPVQELHVG
jgi:ABC-type lipoprotein release transport system permease subunit